MVNFITIQKWAKLHNGMSAMMELNCFELWNSVKKKPMRLHEKNELIQYVDKKYITKALISIKKPSV